MSDSEPSAEPTRDARGERDGDYLVLARKYRPQSFAELIGQDALVRTLRNALLGERVAHAFMLTGVRGTGKTTTARILAKALNCVGPDGAGGPTPDPCGECQHCQAIAAGRDVDVLELDAASHTGVDAMRELLDGVRYRPVAARNKVYIIDEVHMLSNHAFNALLKTLEEPPPNVRFVFATTEIRKVPLTILSRCQRFDLRRIEHGMLLRHLAEIAGREGFEHEDGALALIARAAEGSVRDALSLLDQALARGQARIAIEAVRDMLGLIDRTRLGEVFAALMRGDAAVALAIFADLHARGADPELFVRDLLDIVHALTRRAVVPEADADAVGLDAIAPAPDLIALSRVWQVLLKGLGEVRGAPDPAAAAEMLLIRIAHLADLPSPAEVIERFGGLGGGGPAKPAAPIADAPVPAAAPSAAPSAPSAPSAPETFADIVAHAETRGEKGLAELLRSCLRPVALEPGLLRYAETDDAPADLHRRLATALIEWYGEGWRLERVSRDDGAERAEDGEGGATLREQADDAREQRFAEAAREPLVQAVLQEFPDARIEAVRAIADAPASEKG